MSPTKAVTTTAEERKRAGLAARELQAQADRALLARIMPVVGRNIAQRRETLGLSQRALSDQASVDRIFLRGVEAGERTPTVVFLAKIAPPLQTTVAALTRGIEQARATPAQDS